MKNDKLLREVVARCGFYLRPQGVEVVLIDKKGVKRVLSAAEGNLWADVWERVRRATSTN
jgi:hypothetical protein